MKTFQFLLLALTLLIVTGCNSSNRQTTDKRLIDFVDPFIGTGAHGHVFPGATTPFGMVQLSPNNGVSGWDRCTGYHSSSNQLAGFFTYALKRHFICVLALQAHGQSTTW